MSVIWTEGTPGTRSFQYYYPYGEPRPGYHTNLPTDHSYTGQITDRPLDADGTGLMYYNARYYNPQVGSFTQPDTIVPDPSTPADLNRYAYVRGNPVRYSDPTGYDLLDELEMSIDPPVFFPADVRWPIDDLDPETRLRIHNEIVRRCADRMPTWYAAHRDDVTVLDVIPLTDLDPSRPRGFDIEVVLMHNETGRFLVEVFEVTSIKQQGSKNKNEQLDSAIAAFHNQPGIDFQRGRYLFDLWHVPVNEDGGRWYRLTQVRYRPEKNQGFIYYQPTTRFKGQSGWARVGKAIGGGAAVIGGLGLIALSVGEDFVNPVGFANDPASIGAGSTLIGTGWQLLQDAF